MPNDDAIDVGSFNDIPVRWNGWVVHPLREGHIHNIQARRGADSEQFDNYAGVTYSEAAERIFIGWAANAMYAGDVPAGDFRGSMTLPRRLFLVDTKQGIRLGAEPMLPEASFAPIESGGELPREGAYEIHFRASGAFELGLGNGVGDELRIGLDSENQLYIDRSKAGAAAFNPWFSKPQYSVAKAARASDGEVSARIIVDHTLVEVYAENGAYVGSALVFPRERYDRLRIQNARASLAQCE